MSRGFEHCPGTALQSARRRLGMAVLLALVVAMIVSARAGASAPARLWQVPEAGIASGTGAGEVFSPAGIAVSPFNADIYVADAENARVDEFDAWGQFVRAFGWGVVASGPDNRPQNEIQEVTVNATGGTFKLDFTKSFDTPEDKGSYEQVTEPISVDASPAEVREALEGLESLGPGDVSVTGAAGGPWRIEFVGGDADANIAPIQGDGKNLTGGAASISVETIQGGASYEICEPQRGDVCREGQYGGSAPGELSGPAAVAVGPQGDVYVYETGEQHPRVQEFSAEGRFELMLGGHVDKTTGSNLCTAANVAEGDECGAGASGTEPGEFTPIFGTVIAVAKDGTLYVGDEDRIQEFDSQGVYEGQIALPGEASAATESLAVDGEGSLYLDFVQDYAGSRAEHPGIYKRNGSGWSLLSPMTVPMALAVAPSADVYVAGRLIVESNHSWHDPSIFELDSSGRQLVPDSAEEAARIEAERFYTPFSMFGEGFEIPGLNGQGYAEIIGLAAGDPCGIVGEDVYASYSGYGYSQVVAYGPNPNPNVCPPPPRAPSIAEQYATAVGSESATVRAKINTHFWPDATYEVEYGTEPCSLGGCVVAGTGSPLRSESNIAAPTAGVALTGLQAASTYHFRFVAESGGGGPVKGVGGEVGSDGAEGEFTTSPSPTPVKTSCPNQVFRSGAGAALSDCRAYEMVSPVEKEGGNVVALGNVFGYPARLDQSSVSGDRLSYSAYSSFGDEGSAPFTSQYIANRAPGAGWSSTGISPVRGRDLLGPGDLDIEYRAFSPELCNGWLRFDYEADPPLDPKEAKGFPNIYRANLCEGGGYEALTTSAPPGMTAEDYTELELDGVSADGSQGIFVARANLTADTSSLPDRTLRLYLASAGQLHYICIMPDGTPAATECAAGGRDPESGDRGLQGRLNDLVGAISSDGSRVFFSTEGKLYVRENSEQPQSAIEKGRCDEPELACTLAVSEAVSGETAFFWVASADGSRVIFSTAKGDLYEYSVTKRKATLIAEGALGVMGASEDASRLYFASTRALAGSAAEGQPNLYFQEAGGTPVFIATLAGDDIDGQEVSAITPDPINRVARVTPDGLQATFMSNSRALSQSTAGYDNSDQVTGEPDEEVYLYDEAGGHLLCISCNPTGARPDGAPVALINGTVNSAAHIPTWESDLYASRVLSNEGDRLFFESFEDLTTRDTNGKQDVYEWEAASSAAACEEDGAELYVRAAGGCISLISSGESSEESSFVDASASGDDVFFTTGASLVAQDPGLIDIYDARVDGGFPGPSSPDLCEGEACQAPATPPSFATPGSLTFNGIVAESQGSGNKGSTGKSKGHQSKKAGGDGKRSKCRRKAKSRKAACRRKRQKRKHKRTGHRRSPIGRRK